MLAGLLTVECYWLANISSVARIGTVTGTVYDGDKITCIVNVS